MSMPTSPGWYDDPEDAAQLRYFDGVVWSKHTTPRSTRPAPAATPQPGQQQFPGQGHPQQYAGQVQAPGQAPVQPPGQAPAQPPAPAGWQAPGAPQGPHAQFPGSPQPGWSTPPQQGWPQPAGPATTDGQPLASYGQRVGAFVIDFIATSLVGGILSLPIQLQVSNDLNSSIDDFSRGNATFSDVFDAAMKASDAHLVPLTLIALATSFIYHVVFVALLSATPGKLLLGISIRRTATPGRVGWAVAVRRRLLQVALGLFRLNAVAELLYLLGSAVDLLWPSWDRRRQALHDKLADTVVVRGRAPRR